MATSVDFPRALDRCDEILSALEPLYGLVNAFSKEIDTPLAMPAPIALNLNLSSEHPVTQLCDRLQLEESERDILLLCLLLELRPQLKFAIARIQQDPELIYPTFHLASILFQNFTFGVLRARSPLNEWQLVATNGARLLMESPLKLDPFVFLYLIGENDLDRELMDSVYPVSDPVDDRATLYPGAREIVDRMANLPLSNDPNVETPFVELCGTDRATRRQIAATVCETWKRPLYRAAAISLPLNSRSLYQWQQRWKRQALLTQSILLLEIDSDEELNEPHKASLLQFLSECRTPVIVSAADRSPLSQRQKVSFEIPKLAFAERKKIWTNALDDRAAPLGGALDILADRFPLSPQSIATICHQAPPFEAGIELANCLWDACRDRARLQFGNLAQRVETPLNWDDLVLPEDRFAALKEIVAMARNRYVVHHPWGFAGKKNRGLGLCALFTGQSGTGKTTAAEIIAKELNLDCYRVDLSAIASKYIGETEKNLKQIFDAAEAGSAMLLFDEADALFGKRGEVKEARDRYANQGVSYLLQRLEVYPGVAILTTNLKDSIDSAFERRLKFVVDFPFPDLAQRMEIWKKAFPPQTPTQDLDYERLAQLQVSGGSIANIALDAAFRAAEDREPVQMKHLLAAAIAEAKRMKRNLIGRETFGWVQS